MFQDSSNSVVNASELVLKQTFLVTDLECGSSADDLLNLLSKFLVSKGLIQVQYPVQFQIYSNVENHDIYNFTMARN